MDRQPVRRQLIYRLGHSNSKRLDTVPDELLHSRERFRTRLRWDTYSHYPIHAEHVREWRAGFKRDQDTGKRSSQM
jgi:hypothetical protein